MTLTDDFWPQCLRWLEGELDGREVSTWIRPLHPLPSGDRLQLLAPNRIVMDNVREKFLVAIQRAVKIVGGAQAPLVELSVGTAGQKASTAAAADAELPVSAPTKLDSRYTFERFIEGKSNAYARAAAQHAVEDQGGAYNPLLIYGESGMGKTHLMHAVGNAMLARNPKTRIVYIGAEQWVNQFTAALRHGRIEEFKSSFRTADALLIDDIQFFANKERTQDEFFHTFNALIEARKQIILTCDRYPKEVDGIDDRLQTRFSWGLSVAVEPPDLETRVAILQAKAEQARMALPEEVAMFVAQRVRSNVRELEGALNRLSASTRLKGEGLSVEFARLTLKDMLAAYERKITVDNIMKTVAAYYNIRVADLTSPRRTRSLARPRQLAMALVKDLTRLSLPEIGNAFSKDHTTVLHACRKVLELRNDDLKIREDWDNLQRQLGF